MYDLRGYASGTLSSKKGLATVDENGKEIILDKSSPGRYRLTNEGEVFIKGLMDVGVLGIHSIINAEI